MVYVSLQSDKHNKGTLQHRESRVVSLAYSTDSSLIISREAVKIAKQIFKTGVKYKRAGVIVMGLVPTSNHQLQLFNKENPKHKPLMQAIDSLNEKYAGNKVKLANQDLKRTWKMRQERLSPRYTTNIEDIIVVK